MKKKYLLFTIGPVQSYIEEARKTSDLYNGSSIIVDLVKSAYRYLLEESDIKIENLILPSLNKDDFLNLKDKTSNFFIALAEGKEESFFSFKKNVKEKILHEYVHTKVPQYINYENLQNIHDISCSTIINQLKDIFDIYIVYEDGEKTYEKAYKNLYRKLDAYKNSRYFEQRVETKSPYKGKCSICGVRNADFLCFDDKLIDKKEKLCHACYFKRIKNKTKDKLNYPSTAAIAAKSWVEKQYSSELSKYQERVKKLLKNKYKEYDKNYFYYKDWLKEKYPQLYKVYEKSFNTNPSKYYALVKADVDNLGKWFSKDNLEIGDLLEYQKQLSKLLLDRAEELKEKYSENEVVYAGGDDYLLLISLNKLFQLMEDLARKIIAENEEKEIKITLSQSVVIARYDTPLEKVLKIGRETLDRAKDKYAKEYSEGRASKNATAITFITGSDTYRTGYYKNDRDTFQLIKNLTEVFKEKLSRSFLFTLENEFRKMEGKLSNDEKDDLKYMIKSEVERLIKKKEKQNFVNYQEIADGIYDFLCKQEIKYAPNKYILDLKNFFNILHISEKLSHEIKSNQEGGSRK